MEEDEPCRGMLVCSKKKSQCVQLENCTPRDTLNTLIGVKCDQGKQNVKFSEPDSTNCKLVTLDTNKNGMTKESVKTNMEISVEDNHLIEKSSALNVVVRTPKSAENDTQRNLFINRLMCFGPRLISILLCIITVQLIVLIILLFLLFSFGHSSISPNSGYRDDPDFRDFSKDTAEHIDHAHSFIAKPRCFSMCESPDIFYRDDKLIKTVVTFSAQGKLKFQPGRYYMFLFPDPPIFTETEVGSPLYLTPLIKSGLIEKARDVSLVTELPILSDLKSYSGFITVNEDYNSNMFFWFFPAQSGNISAPVIIWLQGGPGSTGLFGLLKEHGPILADVDPTGMPFVKENPYSWTKNYSVIYVDNPVGTGFSFTEHISGYPNFVENSTEDLYVFLQQFYKMFPEQQSNFFYIFGESYGGKYAPQLAYKIHEENKNLKDGNIKINLVGVGIGNGWMSPADQGRYANYLHYHGLLDKQQLTKLNGIDDKIVNLITSENFDEAWRASDEQLDFILSSLNYSNLYDMTKDQYRPSTMNFWFWVEQLEVRKALHVGNQTFSDGLDIYMSMVGDTMRSIKPIMESILPNYKVLAYHGAMDIICHYNGAEEMFSTLSWNGTDEFQQSTRKSWWAFNDKTSGYDLAGYYKKGGNLNLFLIRNAGHSVPLNQPLWAFRLLEDFIEDRL